MILTRKFNRIALLFVLSSLAITAQTMQAALSQTFTPAAPASPDIPERAILLTDYGAVPDGKTLNTEAFAKAIQSLSDQGGGKLIVPPGIWLTGPIQLKSKINLHLQAGSLIQFSRDFSHYKMRLFDVRGHKIIDCESPLFGQGLEDIAITGSGIIDGGGDAWRLVKRPKVTKEFWENLVASGGVLNQKGDEWWPSQQALDGREAVRELEESGSMDLAAYEPYKVYLRPRLVRLLDCKRILIEGITILNAPNWTVHPWVCEDVTILNVQIINPKYAQNSDALDIESCKRVYISGCTIDTGDDAICIKSGINELGRSIGVPTEDVLIENCTVFAGHGGFTIGSEMSGGVRNVLARNLTFIGTNIGLRFKTARGRGGVVENIHLQDIRMYGIKNEAISMNFYYFTKRSDNEVVPPVTVETPTFRNILFENITARDAGKLISMHGLPEMPIQNVTYRNVSLTGKVGIELSNCDGLTFENVSIYNASGEALQTANLQNAEIPLEILKSAPTR